METATRSEALDVVEVMRCLVGTPSQGSSLEVVEWQIEAADRVIRVATAIQADAIRERDLMVQFPPLPDPAGPADPPDPVDSGADAGGAEPEPDPQPGPLPGLGPKPESPPSPGEQERRHRRAWLLGELSLFAGAFRGGRVSLEHVDVLAGLTFKLEDRIRTRVFDREPDLLAAALTSRVDVFRRMVNRCIDQASDDEGAGRLRDQKAKSFLKHWVRGDRMHRIYLELDPDRGRVLFERLEAEMAAIYASGGGKGLTREQVAIQAFCNLQAQPAASEPASDPAADSEPGATPSPTTPSGPAPTAGKSKVTTRRRSSASKGTGLVLIDIDTLLGGLHDRSVCETASGIPLPPSAVREFICQAAIKYGLTINGRLIGSFSKQALATADQRLMLRAMYRTCAFPGCTHKFDDCEIHHVSFRSKGGHTLVDTMIPLCRQQHHDDVHVRGWGATIDAERTLRWVKPGGEVYDIVPFVPLADLDRLPFTGAKPEQPEPPGRPPPTPRPKPARSTRIARAPDPPPSETGEQPSLFDSQHPPAA
jgi:hypothetical protein